MSADDPEEAAGTIAIATPLGPKVLLGFAILIPRLIDAVYRGLDRDPPDPIGILGYLLLLGAIVTWFQSYCRALRISLPMDMGWFLLLGWPFVVPYFMIRHEGRRGLGRLAAFVAVWVSAAAVGLAVTVWTAVIAGGD